MSDNRAVDNTRYSQPGANNSQTERDIFITDLFTPNRWDQPGKQQTNAQTPEGKGHSQESRSQTAEGKNTSDKMNSNAESDRLSHFEVGGEYFYNRSGKPLNWGKSQHKKEGAIEPARQPSPAGEEPLELPVVRILGANASDVWKDDSGNVTETSNQFAKNRTLFGYDKNNDLNSVTKSTLGSEPVTFKRDQGSDAWYTEVGGEKVYLPGKVEVRSNGELAIQQKDGSFKIEEPSGAVSTERLLANGAMLRHNADGTTDSIKRADGSEVHCHYVKGKLTSVDEKEKGAAECKTWRQEGGVWKCAGGNDKPRTDLQVNEGGQVSYKTEDGLNQILQPGGEKITTGTGRSGTSFDANGKMTKYVYEGEKGARGFERDQKGRINKYSEYDKEGEVVRTFTRDGDKTSWKVADKNGKPGGVWQGEFATDSRGWSSVDLAPGTKPEDLRWLRVNEKGVQTHVKTEPGGINVTSDLKNNITNVLRANGTTADCQYKDGLPVKITTTNTGGKKPVSFTYDQEKKVWHSDNNKIADSTDSPLLKDGTVKYKTTEGHTVTVRLDGTSAIAKADGSAVDLGADGRPTKCRANDGSQRTFVYSGNKLTGFDDTVRGKTQHHDIDSGDVKKQYQLSPLGDLEYRNLPDGTKRVNSSNLDVVEYNGKDQVSRVCAHNGTIRDIEYGPDGKKPVSISDTRPGPQGPITRKFEWRDGFGDSMALVNSKDGKDQIKEARHKVQLDQHGNYSYLSQAGETRLCRPGDQFARPGEVFDSAAIDQARSSLRDTMAASFNDENRSKRLDEMMSGFEKRMNNTIERRASIGEDANKLQEQVEGKVVETYRQLERMVAGGGNTFDGKDARLNLAETFMYHAYWPQSITQQGWNSCWSQSQWELSLGEHPDAYAKMMADVSLTGKYTDLNNKTYNFSPSDLAIRERRDGRGWSINDATHNGSLPSPVANRIDRVVATVGGRGPWGISYGGTPEEARRAVEAITGDSAGWAGAYPSSREQRLEMVRRGGAQRDPGPGHTANYELAKVGDQWALVRGDQYNDRDRVVAIIRNLKQWVENGESAVVRRDLAFEPKIGQEYTVKDRFEPSEYVASVPPTNTNHEDAFSCRQRHHRRRYRY